ncbi:MAG: FAD-dependent oxidoreductase, partial [Clostridia bacterium]|nr:FAD-dependent oxidoreductase [Clostridia bacterium]
MDCCKNNVGGGTMDGSVSLSLRHAEIKGSYDVIVCGAGIAGIAAALSAKRAGAKRVLLLEREYAPGGLATLGLVTIYLPLCDGRGHQVSFGISQELLRLSVSEGAEQPIPACWVAPAAPEQRRGERYRCRFNAGLFTCLAERLLVDSGVKILYGATVFDALREGKRLTALVCLQAEGLAAYEANGFVDASGDAVLFACAGEETALYDLGNRQAAWY